MTGPYAAVEQLAEAVRARLGIGADPVGDILAALANAGLVVLVRPLGAHGPEGAYIRRQEFGAVLLNGDAYLPRLRFTAAHELGHHELGAEAVIDQTTNPAGNQTETEASVFAAAFLLPTAGLEQRLDAGQLLTPDRALALADEFGVSYQTLVYRVHNTGLLVGGWTRRDTLLQVRPGVLTDDFRRQRLAHQSALPADYVGRALAAYRAYRVSLDRLAELLFMDEASVRDELNDARLLNDEDA